MIRSSKLQFVVVSLAALAAVLSAGAPRAEAQTKPFKIVGSGPAPLGVSLIPGVARPHGSVGVATHLGKYNGDGFFQIAPPVPGLAANQASFSGCFTFVAANGDKLVCTYGKGGTGVVTLTPVGAGFTAFFVAEFNPVPNLCTGRFQGVTGSWIMYAQSAPFTIDPMTFNSSPFMYSWQGEGTLSFPK